MREVALAEEEEIAVGVNDSFDLPTGVTSDEFSLYVVRCCGR